MVNSVIRKPLQLNPLFKWSFVSPKYWITWDGIGFLYFLSWLPFRVQLTLGKWLGNLLHALSKLSNYPDSNSNVNAVIVNNWVEQSVLNNTEQYMWVHRRFKTRPANNKQPLY